MYCSQWLCLANCSISIIIELHDDSSMNMEIQDEGDPEPVPSTTEAQSWL
jgi:hypothetical protein